MVEKGYFTRLVVFFMISTYDFIYITCLFNCTYSCSKKRNDGLKGGSIVYNNLFTLIPFTSFIKCGFINLEKAKIRNLIKLTNCKYLIKHFEF